MRLFVALPLPAPVLKGLAELCSGLPGARWVAPENMHVTLRFIGEADGAGADDAHMALSGVRGRAFPLALTGLGSFQSGRRLRMLWAGVDDEPALVRLRDDVEKALVRSGLEPERRKKGRGDADVREVELAGEGLDTGFGRPILGRARVMVAVSGPPTRRPCPWPYRRPKAHRVPAPARRLRWSIGPARRSGPTVAP